jgi:multiple antibiotic resistance protein
MESFIIPLIKSVVALFIITDSPGNLPFFMGLTEGETSQERRKTFTLAILTGFFMLIFFIFAGTLILDLFNVTLDDFKIAGGILLLYIAIELMLRGKFNVEHKEDIGVVPLGIPLLVGPGAITTSLVLLKLYGYQIVLSAILICFFLIFLVLYFAENIYRFLGKNGTLIITKIAAILIAAIAVQFIRQGIIDLIRIAVGGSGL